MFALLFGISAPVGRKAYALAGFGLMGLKYALDFGGVYYATGRHLMPLEFLSPLLTSREHLLKDGPDWIAFVMILWALPFMWVGLSMTFRRAIDAGLSPWWSFLFVVPFINSVLMIVLCFLPSRPEKAKEIRRAEGEPGISTAHRIRSVIVGTGLGVVLTIGMVAISALGLRKYGAVLFLTTPFVIGATAGFVFNQGRVHAASPTVGVGVLAVLLGGMALLLFAFEGIICISMAAPLAAGVGAIGAIIGREVAIRGFDRIAPLVVVAGSLPLLAAAEATVTAPSERRVVTTVDIDASPEAVWAAVIDFPDLPPPPRWYSFSGLAYPQRARLEGRGVGAVRHCEFSTGAFVEPITVWDEPRRLAFDVVDQPSPMTEWSPYRHIHPPHLDGYIDSKRGQFLLTPLPNGGTRLSGTTWYTLDIYPTPYWALWSDFAIRKIHEQVLRHVAATAVR